MLSGSKGLNGGIIIRVSDLEKKIVSLKPQSIQNLQDEIKKSQVKIEEIEKNNNNNIDNNNKLQKDIEEIKNCSCNCDCYEKSQEKFEKIRIDIEELKNNNNGNNECCDVSQFKIDYLSDKIEKLEKILLGSK